jgi:hypothetical protein
VNIVGLVTFVGDKLPPGLNRKDPWSPFDSQIHRAEHKTANLSHLLALLFGPFHIAGGAEAHRAQTPSKLNLDMLLSPVLLVISKILFSVLC